jgi:hypothetical protein
MTSFDEFLAAVTDSAPVDPLRIATLAYLARYKGDSRMHTESDLRIFLAWCVDRDLPPLKVQRAQIELYIR